MSPQTRPADLPEIIGGRYRVLAEIGRGGMGRVLKVEHLHTGEVLAMKVLLAHRFDSAQALERFRREARVLAQVRGEHIVRVIDADIASELGETPYIVTELLDGEDLYRYLKRRGRLDPSEVWYLLHQLARGLSRVHRSGLVHRDLKPGNIFLDRQEDRTVLKLLDFGLVKLTTAVDDSEMELTREGQVLGTPVFMSPEQVHGRPEEITTATDIWAVGMIAYLLLTGRTYWDLRHMERGIWEIGAAPLQPPSLRGEGGEAGLTGAFDAWFLRSCALNPALRWPDPLTQWRELTAALGSPAALESPAAPGSPASGPRSGAVLDEDAETILMYPRTGESSARSSSRQRRQVTVLFYRIVHAARSGEMDPEDFETREINLHSALGEALGDLRSSSTHLAQGGRFVFFGYPVAYGHDARRAVEAALRLVDMARHIDAEVRVGVHTGLALTGAAATAGGTEVTGAALGVATDLEHSAKPGEILVSEATWELLGGRFRGERVDSGNYAAGNTYHISGVAEESPGLSMFGRDAELALLFSCLEEARSGEGQTVLISGEVGIGKSRLVQALREHPDTAGVAWLECGCSPYFQRTPFRPLIGLLSELKIETLDEEPRAFLHALLPGASVNSEIGRLSPALRRERTIHALIAVLHARAQLAPLALVVEDLHWADPSTLEFLDRLSVLRNAPLLTVMTARLDFAPSWNSPAAITPVQLRRLPQTQAAQLIAQISKDGLSPAVAEMLVKTTEGIPLFIEELTRLVAQRSTETTSSDLASGSVPTTLRDALNARLDHLGPARVLAEQAAVIGPEFSIEDLRILAGDDPGLAARVRELVRGKVFQPRGLPPHERYTFQHALLRDAAYGSLPKETRRDLHARLALELSQRKTKEPEILAQHFAEGGMPLAAAGWRLQAGQAALERSANAEAREHFERGIALLEKYRAADSEADAVATLEITLWIMRGMAWVVSRGYAVPEVAESFTAAMERVRRLNRDETPELTPALWAQWVFLLVRGRFAEAEEQSQRLMRLADRCGNAGVTMLAHLALGTTLHGMGRFHEALEHLEQGLALYDPAAHGLYRFLYGQDPWMFGSVFRAWVLWCIGFPDRALEAVNQAIAHAQKLRHPNSLGFALALSAIIHHYRGEVTEVAHASQALLDLSLEQGWIQWLGHAKLWGGAAQVAQGNVQQGLAAMREGRGFAQQAGERSGATHYDTVMIEALCTARQLEEASQWIARTKPAMQQAGEYAFEADLLRMEGEVARMRGDNEAARRLFLEARQSAASRGARSYELRAERSLAQLEQEAG